MPRSAAALVAGPGSRFLFFSGNMVVVSTRSQSWWRGVVVAAGLLGMAALLAMIGIGLRVRNLSTAADVAQLVSVGLAVPGLVAGLLTWKRPVSSSDADLGNGGSVRDDSPSPGTVRERGGTYTPTASVGLPMGLLDPFALEVHHPISIESEPADLPLLPAYVSRAHDRRLAEIVERAMNGRSGMAVLVGGSSTGKTRACWEAIQILPPGWRVWHPISPNRADAMLDGLAQVSPQTVVWLNEAQEYLDGVRREVHERVAAELRDLLRDPDRAPVLMLGTIWPERLAPLVKSDGKQTNHYSQTRELLAGSLIEVPEAFTGEETGLKVAASTDPRLASAVEMADGKWVTQYLAGVPELLDRYRLAPPTPKALIHAAMDARRLGHGPVMTSAFLEAAVPGYLTSLEWARADEDWLQQAIAYATSPCNGVPGPLIRIKPRSGEPKPGYGLADYLEQKGRRDRIESTPPDSFWAAALLTDPDTQYTLADAAKSRGLFRHAAQLFKKAATTGHRRSVMALLRLVYAIDPDSIVAAGTQAAAWIDHTDPYAVARLIETLAEVDAVEVVTAVLARHPAAKLNLSSAGNVGYLLGVLEKTGAEHAVTALLARDPAAHVDLIRPLGIAYLLEALQSVEAGDAVATLLARDPAAHVDLASPREVARLVKTLSETGSRHAVAVLAERAAARTKVTAPSDVIELVKVLLAVDSKQAIAILAERAAAQVDVTKPDTLATLVRLFHGVAPTRTVAALVDRCAPNIALAPPYQLGRLIWVLRTVGAGHAASELMSRATADEKFTSADNIHGLLNVLREPDLADAVSGQLVNDPAAHVDLTDPRVVVRLLNSLQGADAIAAVANHAAANADVSNPYSVRELVSALAGAGAMRAVVVLTVRAIDPSDHYTVARTVEILLKAQANEEAAALVDHVTAHADFTHPNSVTSLIRALRYRDAREMAVALADRVAAHLDMTDQAAVTALVGELRQIDATEAVAVLAQRVLSEVDFTDYLNAAKLIEGLQKASSEQVAAALTDRATNAGLLPFLKEAARGRNWGMYGRETDGSTSPRWVWSELA
jgi:hypothetical protein